MQTTTPEELEVVQHEDAVISLMNPLRVEILEQLREKPDSASGLGKALNTPRQKINYHLREMEAQGLLELVEEVKRRNFFERVLRAKATSWLIRPDTVQPLAPVVKESGDRLSAHYLIEVAAKVVSDISRLLPRAKKAGKNLPTLTLNGHIRFANAVARRAFAEELSDLIMQLIEKYHDDTSTRGRDYTLMTAFYPQVKDNEQSTS